MGGGYGWGSCDCCGVVLLLSGICVLDNFFILRVDIVVDAGGGKLGACVIDIDVGGGIGAFDIDIGVAIILQSATNAAR